MAVLNQSPQDTACRLIALLDSAANTPYIGEPVSQLEHSLQCAHLAATAKPESDEETIVAALFHDVGQFIPQEDLNLILGEHQSQVVDMIVDSGDSSELKESKNDSVGRMSHESLGAKYLSALGFPEKVTRLVEAHVPAKRYLCAFDEEYYDKLSEASKESLRFQGGPMSNTEKVQFESSPWCSDMCRLRKWDDAAKVVGLTVPRLDTYQRAIERVLEASG